MTDAHARATRLVRDRDEVIASSPASSGSRKLPAAVRSRAGPPDVGLTRRRFIALVGGAAFFAEVPGRASLTGATDMYGLIGRMKVVPGQRDQLISILLDGVAGMPGCLSYVVAQDPTDPDAIWITEVWDSQASHQASLSLPSVQQAISRGRPLVAGFGERFETRPIGGHGLRA